MHFADSKYQEYLGDFLTNKEKRVYKVLVMYVSLLLDILSEFSKCQGGLESLGLFFFFILRIRFCSLNPTNYVVMMSLYHCGK